MSAQWKSNETLKTLMGLYRYMFTSREIDRFEQEYTNRGEAFFHVSGAGHEAVAALSVHLQPQDWLHTHYRDKALLLARGISVEQFFLSLFNKDESHSRGRQMSAHLSDPDLNVLSIVGPVGNAALQAVGIAMEVQDRKDAPIVFSSMGDGMTQQGEFYEAVAHAVRAQLPILFFIEDNAFAISTRTGGQTFFSRPDGDADSFYGIPITHIDGRDTIETLEKTGEAVSSVRSERKPAFVVFHSDRLSHHTNADDQRVYRSDEEIKAAWDTGDPIARLKQKLLDEGVPQEEFSNLEKEITEMIRQEAKAAQLSPEPVACYDAKKPLPKRLGDPKREYTGNEDEKEYTMLEALRETFRDRMEKDDRVSLFGEDIADPKGDVFGLTRGLGDQFPGRILNSPLSEASIVGISVGRALAGGRPVGFLQFADFLPIAYNQIFAEMGSMYWRTDGGWQTPVILMVTTGGYKPGLGPFHASSMESVAAHVPGVDVFFPSSAGDAAGLLNAAFSSGRPTIFFYPKSMLNDRSRATSQDVSKQLVPIGRARFLRDGTDITMVGYGNTVPRMLKAAQDLETVGIETEVIDLRSIFPWDLQAVLKSAEKTKKLIVTHEDSKTVGVGAEVLASLAEQTSEAIEVRRVVRPDTYVTCNFGNQLEILPSYQRLLETACELLKIDLTWEKPKEAEKGTYLVEAIGSSPSDESITIVEWQVKPGDEVKSGDLLAELEADKAVQELQSPIDGEVLELLEEEGDTVPVGTPIVKLKTGDEELALKPQTQEEPGTPILKLPEKKASAKAAASPVLGGGGHVDVGIVSLTTTHGSRIVTNEEISELCPDWSPEDIIKRTGIESRYWAQGEETALSLAVDAAKKLLEQEGLDISDIDALYCSTGTPQTITPSMACLILDELSGEQNDVMIQAEDIISACSGFLYGLQASYDYLQSRPEHRVLLITTEALSGKTDTSDPMTAPIFGDAASASLIVSEHSEKTIRAKVFRPELSAKGENGDILKVPAGSDESIYMDGPKVFLEAVKAMIMMLQKACETAEIEVDELDLVVPHQANQRIINAIRQKIKFPREKVYSNIREYGNTSSTSIPLCLDNLLKERDKGELLGMTAFGGGFTFAGGVLEIQ
ncbi:MAG: beta-ketoacyl-ACP synthase 3 [Spirochaetales bacterium]|nr:beta-ketoacyl-ACP synthase 3 [Spirochaetales bacterium]MCF7938393.1 beta-ketoacyl-ACP synthase 3 [Spirochaetales bacterium]